MRCEVLERIVHNWEISQVFLVLHDTGMMTTEEVGLQKVESWEEWEKGGTNEIIFHLSFDIVLRLLPFSILNQKKFRCSGVPGSKFIPPPIPFEFIRVTT